MIKKLAGTRAEVRLSFEDFTQRRGRRAHIYNGTRDPRTLGKSHMGQPTPAHAACSLVKVENRLEMAQCLSMHSSLTCVPPLWKISANTKPKETKDDPYLQSGRLSRVHFKLYNTLPIRTWLIISIDKIFPIKLPEKLVIRLHSLLCVWKSYLAPLLSRESLSRGHNILYLRRLSVRRRLGVR